MREIYELLKTLLRPYRKTVAYCGVLAVLASLLDVGSPILLGRGFDAANGRAAFAVATAIIVAWAAARFGSDLLRATIAYHGGNASNVVAEKYVRDTLKAFLRKPLSFHYGKKSQETADKVMRMRWQLSNAVSGPVFDLIPAALSVAAILGYLLYLDWRVALSLALATVGFVWYTYACTPEVLSNEEKWNKAQRKVSSFGWDALRNTLVVKSTTNEQFVGDVLQRYGDEFDAVVSTYAGFDRRVANVQNAIIGLGSLAAVLVAIIDFKSGVFTLGRLSTVTAYVFAIFGYVRYVQWQFRAMQTTIALNKEVRAVLAEPDEDFTSGAAIDLRGDIEYRHVRFRYREDKPTLEDVSFVVKSGQCVAIVGESGEGKTTLVDLLGRYYLPQSGEILLDGKSVAEVNLKSLREQMAYVPQDLTLFHDTLGFNIRYGRPDATDEEVAEAVREASLSAFVEALPEKLETIVGERGLKLSGGERQRVALARAFLRKPKIIVLDEPTAHLDSKTEESVRASLDALMKGRTTFIIAHRLRTVQDADLILVLKDGQVVESGTHNELVAKNGAYAALLKAQGGLIAPDEKRLGEEDEEE
jgi:ABC-type multidrug transport system fused ATPase/permease subunit